MLKEKDELFLNYKFKKMYLIVTLLICMIWIVIMSIFNFIDVDILNGDNFFAYYNAFLVIFIITGMIVDEKIRKYPGLIVTFGTSVYCFSYVYICCLRGSFSFWVLLFLVNIYISYLVYKKIYPVIVVMKNGAKLFNTIYLIIILLITIVVGCSMWM